MFTQTCRFDGQWPQRGEAGDAEAMALSGRNRRKSRVTGPGATKPLSGFAQSSLLGALLVSVGLIGWLSDKILQEAVLGEVSSATSLYLVLAVVGFCVSCTAIVFIYAYRLLSRLMGPSFRLIDAMQRVRTGDIGFRVHLRKGDMLMDVANEFNRLLDWLNTNPPCDVTMGSDVVDMEMEEEDDMVGMHAGSDLMPEDQEGQ